MARVTNPDYQNETGLYFIREVGKNISLEHRLPLGHSSEFQCPMIEVNGKLP